jgi:hypothetical protein
MPARPCAHAHAVVLQRRRPWRAAAGREEGEAAMTDTPEQAEFAQEIRGRAPGALRELGEATRHICGVGEV